MNYEQDYYESPEFWSDGMVSDALNTKRIEETINMLPTEVTSLLDVGCGNGVFINRLNEIKPDLQLAATDRSREALKYVSVQKFESSIDCIPVDNNSFDCVSCLQVLEHLPYPVYQAALDELARISKKYILVSVPFNEQLTSSFTQCPKCLSEFNSDLHVRSYTTDDMHNLFSTNNGRKPDCRIQKKRIFR